MTAGALRGGNARTLQAWARELGCSASTLRRAVRRKELLAYRHPLAKGNPYMVSPPDMQTFLEKRRSGDYS
jgi:hypothetical protein